MFEIEYKGANAVVITTKRTKFLFDPAVSLVGLKDLSVNNDVEVTTEDRFAVKNATPKVWFSYPGEYEVGDVAMKGIATQRHIDAETEGKHSTIYRLHIGDIRIVVIGNIAPKLNEQQLEDIGVVDVVIIPVGGNGYTLDATSAALMVRQLEPRAVVPVHYADPALNYEVPQDELDTFVKELAVPVVEAGLKWKIKNTSSLPEQLSLVQIARS
jgi:L-ascorbate metabolism protein UlaG (beta-lactamase superfamily)